MINTPSKTVKSSAFVELKSLPNAHRAESQLLGQVTNQNSQSEIPPLSQNNGNFLKTMPSQKIRFSSDNKILKVLESLEVYNISNSSGTLHLCRLTWSALSWSLRDLLRQIRKYNPPSLRKRKIHRYRYFAPFLLYFSFNIVTEVEQRNFSIVGPSLRTRKENNII